LLLLKEEKIKVENRKPEKPEQPESVMSAA